MAAALLRRALDEQLGEMAAYIEVKSAGLRAVPGSWASPQAMAVMGEEGLDLDEHRACQVTGEMVRSADLVLTMTRYQKECLLVFEPSARGKTWSLGEMAARFGKETGLNLDVEDPFGEPEETYRRASRQIMAFLEPLVKRIKEMVLAQN